METNHNSSYKKAGWIALALALVLVIIDQLTKQWAVSTLPRTGTLQIIPGVLDFTFVKNTGAAFGILQGKTVFLGIISTLFLILIAYALISGRVKNKFLIYNLALIIAGGLGNILDRFFRGYVVDFFDLDFWIFKNFPVFNFADICVSIGAFSLIIYLIFFGKNLDHDDYSSKKKEPIAPIPTQELDAGDAQVNSSEEDTVGN